MSAFEELGISPEIIKAITEENWLLPTPIQAEAIPLILGGSDVCAAAETGTGKTGAFGIPALQIVNETLRNIAVISKPKNQRIEKKICLSIDDKDPYVFVDPYGTHCKCFSDKKWCGVRGNISLISGKYMYEVELLTDGLIRVGWSSPISPLEIGKDNKSFGYGATGKKSTNKQFDDYGEPFSKGDIIGVTINFDKKEISFLKNGKFLGTAFSFSSDLFSDISFKPAICGKTFELLCHFSQLKYPSNGFKAIGEADLADTTDFLNSSLKRSNSNSYQRNAQMNIVCLVLEPTRDLASQTYECFKLFARYIEICKPRIMLCVGGMDDKAQRASLRDGVDICVGTLQKVTDMIRRGEISLSSLKLLILDEADDLIKNDISNDIKKIKFKAQELQRYSRIQTLFFSATLHSKDVRASIQDLTSSATWVDLKGKPTIPESVHFVAYLVDPTLDLPFEPVNRDVSVITDGIHPMKINLQSKEDTLSRKIKLMKPQIMVKIADALKMKSCLVFCRTNLDCDNLEIFLTNLGGGRKFSGKLETGKENPYSCVVLAGMRSQEERAANLEHFRHGDVRFLICTDVAARGIDIMELPYLIMMNIPDDCEQFFHRIGRVGRAERMGLAISIVSTIEERVWYHRCQNRGKNCNNTNLVKAGGCTIWYDEPYYLKVIEERIEKKIPIMDRMDFNIDGVLEILGCKRKDEDMGLRRREIIKKNDDLKNNEMMSIYGKYRGNDDNNNNNLIKLMPLVDDLKMMEKELQLSFLSIRG